MYKVDSCYFNHSTGKEKNNIVSSFQTSMNSQGDGKKFLFQKSFEKASWITQTQIQETVRLGSFSLVSYLFSRKYHPFGNNI